MAETNRDKRRILQMATTSNKGVIDDHFDICPDFNSDCKARQERNSSFRRYNGFVRKEFNVADGPQLDLSSEDASNHPRKYQNTRIEFSDLPLEEAIVIGKEIAVRENLVLYLERVFPQKIPSPCYREVLWHPNGWQPRKG